MSTAYPSTEVVLRDVTLRDGLQLTGGMMSTGAKVDVIRRLRALGVRTIEIGSMARPDLVPPLANTLDVVAELTAEELADSWVWVATPNNVRRAVDAGVSNLQYCLSVSDAHNRANVGRDTEVSMAALPEALDVAGEVDGQVQLCLATAFTCPFDGPVAPDRVLALVTDARAEDSQEVVLCDTLGQAGPQEVSALVSAVRRERPDVGIVFHGHDTWGMGVANTLAAVAAGATTVDGALGGLGGCPFAPGASGNTASEDLLFALRPGWLTPAVLADIVRLGEEITSTLQEPNRARSAQGARSKAPAFPWVISEELTDAGV